MNPKKPHLHLVTAPSRTVSRPLELAFVEEEQDELALLDQRISSAAPTALQLPKSFDFNNSIQIAPANLGFSAVSIFDHPHTGSPYLRLTNELDQRLDQEAQLTLVYDLIQEFHLGLTSLYSDKALDTSFHEAPWSFSSGHSQNTPKSLICVQASNPRALIEKAKVEICRVLNQQK